MGACKSSFRFLGALYLIRRRSGCEPVVTGTPRSCHNVRLGPVALARCKHTSGNVGCAAASVWTLHRSVYTDTAFSVQRSPTRGHGCFLFEVPPAADVDVINR